MSEKSVIDRLVDENDKLRQELQDIRKQREDLNRTVKKLEGEIRSMELKCKVAESERDKQVGETRRFMEYLEQQKKERIKLLTEGSEVKNSIVRKEAQLAKITAQIETVNNQNMRLKKQVENLNLNHVGTLKEKQSTVNTAKLMETKLQASEMEKKYLNSRVTQLENELKNVRSELTEITKKYHEKEIGVQQIYKDDEETKEKLLVEFQTKMSDKDEETKSQLQTYINENSFLKQEIIELKAALQRRT